MKRRHQDLLRALKRQATHETWWLARARRMYSVDDNVPYAPSPHQNPATAAQRHVGDGAPMLRTPREVDEELERRRGGPHDVASLGVRTGGNHDVGLADIPALLLTPHDVATELKLGRTKTYQLLRSGQIPTLRLGRSIRVSRAHLEEWITERQSDFGERPFPLHSPATLARLEHLDGRRSPR